MKKLTKKQRKAIYIKLAESFEKGFIIQGLCYAFIEHSFSSYDTPVLIKEFPELELLWATKVMPIESQKDMLGGIKQEKYGRCGDWYKEFPSRDEEGQNVRATLLCFAAAMC